MITTTTCAFLAEANQQIKPVGRADGTPQQHELCCRSWATVSHEANTNPFPGSYIDSCVSLKLKPVTMGNTTIVVLSNSFFTEAVSQVSSWQATSLPADYLTPAYASSQLHVHTLTHTGEASSSPDQYQ